MKTRTIVILLALSAILASCIPSLYPLYHQKDLVHEPLMEGTFVSGGLDYWQIDLVDPDFEEKISEYWDAYETGKTYRLVVREDNLVQDFALHLLRLDGELYLDLYPVGYDIRHKLLRQQLVPAHIFARAEVTDEHLVLHFFDNEWLGELLEKQQIKISHVEQSSRYILTAKTEELQKFVRKYANDSTTFFEADTLFRRPV